MGNCPLQPSVSVWSIRWLGLGRYPRYHRLEGSSANAILSKVRCLMSRGEAPCKNIKGALRILSVGVIDQ